MGKILSSALNLYLILTLLFSPVQVQARSVSRKPKFKLQEARSRLFSSIPLVNQSTTYNDYIDLLKAVETGEIEGKVNQEQLKKIGCFLIFAALLGSRKECSDSTELHEDILKLKTALNDDQKDFEFGVAASHIDPPNMDFVYGQLPYNIQLEQVGLRKFFKNIGRGVTKGVRESGRFVKRHRKKIVPAIAITVAAVGAAGLIYGVVTSISGAAAGGAAAGGAAATAGGGTATAGGGAAATGVGAAAAVAGVIASNESNDEYSSPERHIFAPEPAKERIENVKEEIIEKSAQEPSFSAPEAQERLIDIGREAGARLAHDMIEETRDIVSHLPPSEAQQAQHAIQSSLLPDRPIDLPQTEEELWSNLHENVEVVFNNEITKDYKFDRGEDYKLKPACLPLVAPVVAPLVVPAAKAVITTTAALAAAYMVKKGVESKAFQDFVDKCKFNNNYYKLPEDFGCSSASINSNKPTTDNPLLVPHDIGSTRILALPDELQNINPGISWKSKEDEAKPGGKPGKAFNEYDGEYFEGFPDRPLQRDPRTQEPATDLDVPHTQLGTRKGTKGKYKQAREFDADGNEVRRIDFTDHGKPKEHTNPHQHRPTPNETGGTPNGGDAEPVPELGG